MMTIEIFDKSMIYLMFDEHQPNQLCGPDGGFTSVGRDSLLFQVGNLFYSFLQVFTAKILFFYILKNNYIDAIQIALNHEQPEWVPAFTKV